MIILLILFMGFSCWASEPPKTTFQKMMDDKSEYRCPVCKKELNIKESQQLFYFNQDWYHVDCWYKRCKQVMITIPLHEPSGK